jgi:hypothetical protein
MNTSKKAFLQAILDLTVWYSGPGTNRFRGMDASPPDKDDRFVNITLMNILHLYPAVTNLLRLKKIKMDKMPLFVGKELI